MKSATVSTIRTLVGAGSFASSVPADVIPYTAVYESQSECQKRGYFMPGHAVTATIVSCERDERGIYHRGVSGFLVPFV